MASVTANYMELPGDNWVIGANGTLTIKGSIIVDSSEGSGIITTLNEYGAPEYPPEFSLISETTGELSQADRQAINAVIAWLANAVGGTAA